MNTLIRSLLVFGACGALASAAETLNVVATRELRLAAVESGASNEARNAEHVAFASGLSEAASRLCGERIGVKVRGMTVADAAQGLDAHECDAVLVIGGKLPSTLTAGDVSRMRGALGEGPTERKIYLVFPSGDKQLAQVLAGSFDPAVTSNRFLDTVDGGLKATDRLGSGSH